MNKLRVRVQNGRITGEAPPGFPEGEVELCLADSDDALSEEELARLNEALDAAWTSIAEGRFMSATDLLAELRAKL